MYGNICEILQKKPLQFFSNEKQIPFQYIYMYIIIDLKKIFKDFFKDNNNVEGRNF